MKKEIETIFGGHKRNLLLQIALLALMVLLLCLTLSFVTHAAESKEIVGTVTASEWDESGDPSAVELVTDEGRYAISPSGKGASMKALEGQMVKVNGMVTEDDSGAMVLGVSSFEEYTEETALAEEWSSTDKEEEIPGLD